MNIGEVAALLGELSSDDEASMPPWSTDVELHLPLAHSCVQDYAASSASKPVVAPQPVLHMVVKPPQSSTAEPEVQDSMPIVETGVQLDLHHWLVGRCVRISVISMKVLTMTPPDLTMT